MGEKYRNKSGSLGWSCPSNIAIIKYWGKRSPQLPMNPSLSMTLKEARTKTHMEFEFDSTNRNPDIDFRFEGRKVPAFEDRVIRFIENMYIHIPVLAHTSLRIESENTFPHSSGIASSASSMASLALCLMSLENQVIGPIESELFFEKASFIARLGSGSASRSIYPHFAMWGASDDWIGSSDDYAIPVKDYHNNFQNLKDAILIVEPGQKRISSSIGHSLMETNPYSATRFKQAGQNLLSLKPILAEGDWMGFISLMELEALTLHAMMMTSQPGYMLMLPGTLSIIEKIREFRIDTGSKIGFTLDAGANVHLLYAEDDAEKVFDFIKLELITFCQEGRMIFDEMGQGPSELQK